MEPRENKKKSSLHYRNSALCPGANQSQELGSNLPYLWISCPSGSGVQVGDVGSQTQLFFFFFSPSWLICLVMGALESFLVQGVETRDPEKDREKLIN
jgi:hypothetical protein